MKLFAVLVAVCVCGAFGQDQEHFYEENEGPMVLLPLPLFRVRRQAATTDWKLESPGITGTVQHQGTILNTEKHRLDGSAYVSKDLSRNLNVFQPDKAGGKVDYHYKPSHSTFSVGADHTRGFGTDLSAAGRYNFVEKKNFDLGLEGQYNRHFGGPGGSRRPDYGVFLKATGRF